MFVRFIHGLHADEHLLLLAVWLVILLFATAALLLTTFLPRQHLRSHVDGQDLSFRVKLMSRHVLIPLIHRQIEPICPSTWHKLDAHEYIL